MSAWYQTVLLRDLRNMTNILTANAYTQHVLLVYIKFLLGLNLFLRRMWAEMKDRASRTCLNALLWTDFFQGCWCSQDCRRTQDMSDNRQPTVCLWLATLETVQSCTCSDDSTMDLGSACVENEVSEQAVMCQDCEDGSASKRLITRLICYQMFEQRQLPSMSSLANSLMFSHV